MCCILHACQSKQGFGLSKDRPKSMRNGPGGRPRGPLGECFSGFFRVAVLGGSGDHFWDFGGPQKRPEIEENGEQFMSIFRSVPGDRFSSILVDMEIQNEARIDGEISENGPGARNSVF